MNYEVMTYTHIKHWTMPECYAGVEWPNYYSSGFGQSRDSDALERSNFQIALAALGGESETVIVVRESHWAVGWVEWIAIHESNTAALTAAEEQRERYAQYPVLDEDDCSKEEQEESDLTWKNCYSVKERIAYVREYRSQFEFHDYADMLDCIRGRYFAGYASELIS